jgi:hypothetical protein
MKKIAICFSGELRHYDNYTLINSFYKNIGIYKPDIFISGWTHINKSMNHSIEKKDPFAKKIELNCEEIKEKLYQIYPNLKKIKFQNYNYWLDSTDENIKKNIYDYKYNPLTINSYAQIYQIYEANQLKKEYENDKKFKYDIVIRMRTDNCLTHIFETDQIENNTIYNINFPNAYYPNRIYDIFFYGDSKAMDSLSETYLNFLNLLNDKFYNGLCNRDACRILFLQCMKNNINVKSCDIRYTDVYRAIQYEDYYQYILKYNLIKEN